MFDVVFGVLIQIPLLLPLFTYLFPAPCESYPHLVSPDETALETKAGAISAMLAAREQPVVILQRTFLDWTPCFSQPWPGFSFPRIALPFHGRWEHDQTKMGRISNAIGGGGGRGGQV